MRRYQTLIAGVTALTPWMLPAAVEAQRAAGVGQQATPLFNLRSGLAVFELEHSGDGTFVVRLLDDRGALVDTLARTTGSFRGSKAVRVPRSGAYLYDVTASGTWTIAPRPSSATSTEANAGVAPPAQASSVTASRVGVTAHPVSVQATIDAEQAARAKGSFRWMLGGLAGGTLLGPVGATIAYVAANKAEPVPLTELQARRAAHGDVYADAFARAYQAKRRSDRRVAALVGGATGTVVFGFIIAQIVNWSNESGGRGGPRDGDVP